MAGSALEADIVNLYRMIDEEYAVESWRPAMADHDSHEPSSVGSPEMHTCFCVKAALAPRRLLKLIEYFLRRTLHDLIVECGI